MVLDIWKLSKKRDHVMILHTLKYEDISWKRQKRGYFTEEKTAILKEVWEEKGIA